MQLLGGKMNSILQKRRQILKMGTGLAGAALVMPSLAQAVSNVCNDKTPEQTSGPFFPGESKFHVDNDLTRIAGSNKKALGQVVYIRGRVLNSQCLPVVGANVEIWQACVSGKYNNPNDPNTAPLDPNFKYWGETYTDDNGTYEFKTIIPGAYPADVGWIRPPHVHFKISKLGYMELITQMYFGGQDLNDKDLILNTIPAKEKPSVIVDFKPSPIDLEPGSLLGVFDITLQSVKKM